MIIAAAMPMELGKPLDRLYEGPQTNGNLVPCRIMALRVATRDEYVQYGREHYGEIFDGLEDIRRGWTHYYEVSMD